MDKVLFSELELSDATQLALSELGFEHASPIQAQAIPLVMSGRDVIGQAQTGTGKTAAYGIPMIEKLDTTSRKIGALVVCPTRELVMQVATELKKFAKHKKPGVSVQAIYGGDSIAKQLKNLDKGAHVIVGTPGRLIDFINRGVFNFSDLKMVILDEADEMLNMGFREDIETILASMPEDRQTVLFSATMPQPILEIAKRFQKKPAHVKIEGVNLTAANIEQLYFEIHSDDRLRVLSDLMTLHDVRLALCFCNMKVQVDELVADLRRLGFHADGLHGDLSQAQRSAIMAAFREGSIEILVATDVAARGIDVNDVDAVFNWELPFDSEYYVHRVGRTGRAGKSGKAFSFVTGRKEFARLKNIERFAKMRIERAFPPTGHDLWDIKKEKMLTRLKAILEEGKLETHEAMVGEFLEAGFTHVTLAAALLKRAMPKAPEGARPQAKPSSAFAVKKSEPSVAASKPSFIKHDKYGKTFKVDKPKFEKPSFEKPKFDKPIFDKPLFDKPAKADKFDKASKTAKPGKAVVFEKAAEKAAPKKKFGKAKFGLVEVW